MTAVCAEMFEALVAEGEKVQERTKTAADERLAEVREKVTQTWNKLDKVFEDRVGRALHAFNVPTRKDIDVLSKRVHELTVMTKKLSEEEETHGRGHARQGKSRVNSPELASRLGAERGPGGAMSGRRRKGKLGIALAGGGPLGGIYGIGTLVALEKAQAEGMPIALGRIAEAGRSGKKSHISEIWHSTGATVFRAAARQRSPPLMDVRADILVVERLQLSHLRRRQRRQIGGRALA